MGGAPWKADEEVERIRLLLTAVRSRDAGNGQGGCPSIDEIAGLLGTNLLEEEREQVLQHVALCGDCGELLLGLLRIEEAVRAKQPVVDRKTAFGALIGMAGAIAAALA